MVAKITPPTESGLDPFFLLKHQKICQTPQFRLLSREFRNLLEELEIEGTKNGFDITSLHSDEENTNIDVEVEKTGIIFRGIEEKALSNIMTVKRDPSISILFNEKTLVKPITEEEMEAEKHSVVGERSMG